MIIVTVANHQQAQPVTDGPYAGQLRFTAYLYATAEEAETLGTQAPVTARVSPCVCGPEERPDCPVHGTDRARGEYR